MMAIMIIRSDSYTKFFVLIVACDEIHVKNFTAPIICVIIAKDFLGEDQNADI